MTIRRFDVTEDRVCEYEVYGDMVQDSSGAYVLFEDYHASHAYDEAKERELFEAEYAKKIQYDLGFDDAKEQIKSLRDGENYKSRMAYLNGYWSGWKDCAKSRARSAE